MNFIKRHPLLSYFLLAYVLFWAFWIPLISFLQNLATLKVPPWAIPLALFGIYAPTWAALIVTAVSEGKSGLERLIGPLFDWRLAPAWYFLAIFLPLGLAVVAILIQIVWNGDSEPLTSLVWMSHVPAFLAAIPVTLLAKLPFGPLAEELGWRGYALPRLQRQMNALNASLVLGLLWALWHLPAFWVPGAALGLDQAPTVKSIVLYVLNVVGITIVFTWLYNSTRGSLLIDFLFHAAYNALPSLLFIFVGILPHTFTSVVWGLALGLYLYFGAEKLASAKVTKEVATA